MIPPHHDGTQPRASWRVLTTPLGDLLRGRITGPLPPKHLRGWRGVVAASDLPVELRETIAAVAASLRLWSEEKADVARELSAHFADGLASGSTLESLRGSFGDPRQAARLITRAKKRARPAWWRAIRRARQAIAVTFLVMAGVYGYLAAQFWLRSPNIAHNYLAELNAPVLATPESDRAWPLYLDAFLAYDTPPQSLWNGWGAYRPGDPEWPAVLEFLAREQGVIGTLHEASRRATFGMPYSDRLPSALYEKYQRRTQPTGPLTPQGPPETNPIVMNVLLPHLGELRSMARLLMMDAAAAVESRDDARFLRDLETVLGMSRHAGAGPMFISQQVGLAIRRVACGIVDEALRDAPAALPDETLVRAAHLIAGAPDVHIAWEGERLFLLDLLQRVYSDEGNGHGRLTAAGLETLKRVSYETPAASRKADATDLAMGPLNGVVLADRGVVAAEYDRLLGLMRASRERPMWEWTQRADTGLDDAGKRYAVLKIVLPAADRMLEGVEAERQQRDATLTAIAVELFRRRHGTLPASLADLTPELLPRVPLDRMDGRPLRYAVREGRPVIYSIGLDRDDDGGREPTGGSMLGFTWLTRDLVEELLQTDAGVRKYDGDLVIWPPPRQVIERAEQDLSTPTEE